ncbi:phosphatidylserine decarboxylase family protein [Nibrella saemangeumensis]|uniref:phosphatidylserine decarboxylase family protein n=1 Tax=Nibrella saemangeumensis TaxID=1084526 RepID=UPI0031E729A3
MHREGYKLILITAVVLLIFNVIGYLYWFPNTSTTILSLVISLLLFGLIVQFFRVPHRTLSRHNKQVIAPADGTGVVIEETTESEYFNSRRRQVSIFMSPLNVHVNFHPITGTVRYFRYFPGKYLVAWHPKSSTENERTTIVLQLANGIEVLLRQIAGAVARRIVWYVKEGQAVEQGAELGFIKFGSRIDVFLPLDAVIKVQIGEKTQGGVTVLAELPEASWTNNPNR